MKTLGNNMNEEQEFINAAREMLPQYNDKISDEQILEVYNEIKAKLPEEPMPKIIDLAKKMLPQIIQEMEANVEGAQAKDVPQKLDALRSMNNGGM